MKHCYIRIYVKYYDYAKKRKVNHFFCVDTKYKEFMYKFIKDIRGYKCRRYDTTCEHEVSVHSWRGSKYEDLVDGLKSSGVQVIEHTITDEQALCLSIIGFMDYYRSCYRYGTKITSKYFDVSDPNLEALNFGNILPKIHKYMDRYVAMFEIDPNNIDDPDDEHGEYISLCSISRELEKDNINYDTLFDLVTTLKNYSEM